MSKRMKWISLFVIIVFVIISIVCQTAWAKQYYSEIKGNQTKGTATQSYFIKLKGNEDKEKVIAELKRKYGEDSVSVGGEIKPIQIELTVAEAKELKASGKVENVYKGVNPRPQ